MKGKMMKEHMKHRAGGGGIMKAGGNPAVQKEAEEDKDGEVTERKHGGKAKRAKRKDGGMIEGKPAKHRMDRKMPGRKRGGRVGADEAPLNTANRISSAEKRPVSQEGGMSD